MFMASRRARLPKSYHTFNGTKYAKYSSDLRIHLALNTIKRKTVDKLLKVMITLLNDYISVIFSAFISLAAVVFISFRRN